MSISQLHVPLAMSAMMLLGERGMEGWMVNWSADCQR